jgi:hypothetical protein
MEEEEEEDEDEDDTDDKVQDQGKIQDQDNNTADRLVATLTGMSFFFFFFIHTIWNYICLDPDLIIFTNRNLLQSICKSYF